MRKKNNLMYLLLLFVTTFSTAQSLIEIPSPDGFTDKGYSGTPIVFGDDLYMRYQGNDGNFDLMKYDGYNFTEIPSPTGFEGNYRGYWGEPIILGDNLYLQYKRDDSNSVLFKYDGSTLTEIPSPAGFTKGEDNYGYKGNPIVFDGNLYLQYIGDDYNFVLFKYDGSTLTEIPSTTKFTGAYKGYKGFPIVFDGNLYMRYHGDDNNYYLMKYDGNTLSEIPNPEVFTTSDRGLWVYPIVYGDNLYLQYKKNNGNHELFKYSGSTLTAIPAPGGFTDPSTGCTGTSTVFGDDLYLQYKKNDDKYYLFKYNGNTLTKITPPTGFSLNTTLESPTVYEEVLFLSYISTDYSYTMFEYNGSSFKEIPYPSGFTKPSFLGAKFNPLPFGGDLYLQFQGKSANYFDLFKYDGSVLEEISSPTDFTNPSRGYHGEPLVFGGELYLKYGKNNGTFSLFKYGYDCPEGFTCGVVSEVICDADSYTTPEGTIYTETGSYEEVVGSVKTFYNITFTRTVGTQDLIADETLSEETDYTAVSNTVSYLDFHKVDKRYANLTVLQDDLDSKNRSVFMWVKKHTDVSGVTQGLFSINNSTGTSEISLLSIRTNEKVSIWDGGSHHEGSVIDNNWHYIGYTYNHTTSETKIYVDGVLDVTFTNSQKATSVSTYYLGRNRSSSTQYFDGFLTEVSVWDEVLNQSEIATAMGSKIMPTHPKYTSLVGYYSFPECGDGATVLKDWSGKGNDGVMVNLELPTALEEIPDFDSSDWFNYQWFKDDAELGTTKTISVTDVGDYKLNLSRSYFGVTEEFVIDRNALSVEGSGLTQTPTLKLYPNPTNDILKLELGNQVLDYISVKNSQGQELFRSNKTEISMGHLISGVYFVSIKTNKTQSVFKIVKK